MPTAKILCLPLLLLLACGDPPLPAAAKTSGTSADGSTSADSTLAGSDGTASADTPAGSDAPADVAADSVCTPDCKAKGKLCGDDGCGGTCGFCAADALCSDFVCKALTGADACKTTQCDKNADCVLENNAAKCVCKTGWAGDGKTCNDIDDCLKDNGGCDKNAACTDVKASLPTCACNKGYSGNGKTCSDIDECAKATAQCAPHAVCTNTPGTYECKCDEGFSGDGLAGCTDIDECKAGTSKCTSAQVCDNTVGSYVCSCAPGYTKSGGDCNDIDECLDKPCSDKATCKNAPGSYACTCTTGFQGDGKTCTEIDLCKDVKCPTGALCQKNASAIAVCVCAPGYTGDGKVCTQAVVDITLTGVFVAPLMADGGCWDNPVIGSCSKPSAATLAAIDKAYAELQTAAKAGSSNWPAKTTALQTALQALSGTSRPDAYGDAVLQPANASLPLSEVGDTNTPTWPKAAWTKVALGPTSQLKVTLSDGDFAFDDEIGSVTLQIDWLSKALAVGPVTVGIPVTSQNKQILAVLVVIKPWKGCGDGKCEAPETATSCKADCATTGPKCGDAKCDSGETVGSCPADCKVLAGSCKGVCDKQSADGCWCDDYCENAGDCCSDKLAVCAIGCKGKCGQQSKDASDKVCWCDDLCTKNKDCCTDFTTACP